MAVKKGIQDKFAGALQKRFGADAATRLGKGRTANAQVKEVLSCGIDVVDQYIFGIGGLPVGRITEVYGGENCGKTTLMYAAIAKTQSAGGLAVVLDADRSFDETRAVQLGVKADDLVVCSPEHMEDAFEMMKEVLAVNAADPSKPLLLCWDAIASLVTAKMLSVEATKTQPGGVARVTSSQFPHILRALGGARAHLLCLNQTRVNLGIMFGSNITTPGGGAPKFYSSNRMQIMGGKAVKNAAGQHIGKDVLVSGTKTRFVPPFRQARVRLLYGKGFDNDWTNVEWAKSVGELPKDAKVNANNVMAAHKALLAANAAGALFTATAPAGAQESGDPDGEEMPDATEELDELDRDGDA